MDKHKLVVKIALEVARAAGIIGITVFIMLNYFIKPQKNLVVLDIKEIIGYEQQRTIKMPPDKAVEEIAQFVKGLSESIQGRDDIVLVKDAVLNSNKLKDITNEYKR